MNCWIIVCAVAACIFSISLEDEVLNTKGMAPRSNLNQQQETKASAKGAVLFEPVESSLGQEIEDLLGPKGSAFTPRTVGVSEPKEINATPQPSGILTQAPVIGKETPKDVHQNKTSANKTDKKKRKRKKTMGPLPLPSQRSPLFWAALPGEKMQVSKSNTKG